MIVINTDTGHLIKYVTLINDLKLHDEDREITSRMKIMNITTEVSEKNRNSERRYYLNWYTVSKTSIKGH